MNEPLPPPLDVPPGKKLVYVKMSPRKVRAAAMGISSAIVNSKEFEGLTAVEAIGVVQYVLGVFYRAAEVMPIFDEPLRAAMPGLVHGYDDAVSAEETL